LFSLAQLQAILTALPDPAFILTRSGRYAAIFGGTDLRYYHDPSSLIGRNMRDVLSEEKAAWFSVEIEKALASRMLHIVEYRLAGSDVKGLPEGGPENIIWFEGRVHALDFQVQGEDAVLWGASNMTARNELEAQLRSQSESDALSGLYNRRKLMDALKEHYETFMRYGTPSALLMLDIDHFKQVNDTYGHLLGDQVIAAVAEVCRSMLRTTDFPARFGGDEFVILMPHTSAEQAAPIADRLRVRVSQTLQQLGTIGEGATVSGGLSELLPMDTSFEEVLRRADGGLYQAKRDGRDRIMKG
jgi:diguanylate cyclase (GGDEF)-like protein